MILHYGWLCGAGRNPNPGLRRQEWRSVTLGPGATPRTWIHLQPMALCPPLTSTLPGPITHSHSGAGQALGAFSGGSGVNWHHPSSHKNKRVADRLCDINRDSFLPVYLFPVAEHVSLFTTKLLSGSLLWKLLKSSRRSFDLPNKCANLRPVGSSSSSHSRSILEETLDLQHE